MPTQQRPRVLDCPRGSEYDETAFHYFLATERARAARAGRPLRLLLAALEPTPDLPMPFSRGSASRLFSGLRAALRETDVIGWYRQDHVAGAVLSAWQEALVDGAGPLDRRIEQSLRRCLPDTLARSLRVRVVEHDPPAPIERGDS